MPTSRTVTWLAPTRLFWSWGEMLLALVALIAPVIGYTRLDSCASRSSRLLEPDDRPGSGVTVRAEVLHLWLPETLIELAAHQPRCLVAQTHDDLRSFLECRGQRELWYAFTTRSHQVNGGIVDTTVIRHPYKDPNHFPEFLDVLGTAAGNPPTYPALSYSGAEVHVLPGKLSEREPSEVVEELTSRPFPPQDAACCTPPAPDH